MLTNPVLIAASVGVAVSLGIVFFLLSRRPPATQARTPSPYRDRFDEVELARRLEVSTEFLQQLSPSYQTRKIPKTSGGTRTLEIPDEQTRALQRKVLRKLLAGLDCHPFACGFEAHTSIVDAALPHVGKAAVVKLDIRQFFESTTEQRVRTYFEDIGWTTNAAELLIRITCYRGHLPQGAPTSPRLSNLVNSAMDAGLLQLAKLHGGSYSRYADDITFSFNRRNGRRVRGIIQAARRIVRSYGYTLHGKRKQRTLRQHQQQRVLGLVVNSKVALPRRTRRWLRAVEHHHATGRPATLNAEQLRGWKAFEQMVEDQRSRQDG